MIISESVLEVLDNSGALKVKCFRVFGKNVGLLGSLLMVSIKTFRSRKKVKKGEVYKAIVIRLKKQFSRNTGMYIKFDTNAAVLWKRKENSPIGTRVLSIIPLEIRFWGYSKVVVMAEGSF